MDCLCTWVGKAEQRLRLLIDKAKTCQTATRASLANATFASGAPRYHLSFALLDAGVLWDALKVLFTSLDRLHGQLLLAERKRIKACFRAIIPELCAHAGPIQRAVCGALRAWRT
jgi:hypothetical protein